MPTHKKENADKLTDPTPSIESGETGTLPWADIEELLDEWEIGGPAMTTEAIRALIAGD